MKQPIRYLLVTHIPFSRNERGEVIVDGLWARDLIGLTKSNGPIRVVAPEYAAGTTYANWGSNSVVLNESSSITFRGFPPMSSARSLFTAWKIRRILREEVSQADLVHTSNFFPPYTCLSHAHDVAVELGKKTLFVIAEDFHDMFAWEWVRPARGFSRLRREFALKRLDSRVRKSAATASLTLMHTPAAVERYRLAARHSMMIRQPGHEAEHVISGQALQDRLISLQTDRPLRLLTACRHSSLKGLDLLIRSIGLLKDRGLDVHLTMYGSGPETESLRKLAASLDVAQSVNFPGSLSAGPELDHALQQGDLFVMPHRTTDFGRAFFDAMAAGLPVIAFRTPASITTVYDGEDGYLTPLDDVQGLSERIAYLDRNRSTLANCSQAARRRALDNTRSHWFDLRSAWTRSLWNEASLASA